MSGARIPKDGLSALAFLRIKGGVHVVVDDPAWVQWEGERPEVVAALLAVPGAEFFEPHDGQWSAVGSRLPAFDLPIAGEATPFDRVVVPAPFAPIEPEMSEPRRVPLRIVRSDIPRSTSAIRCSIVALQVWADSASAAEITALKAAHFGNEAWLLSKTLPAIAGALRFWGERVLIPLGWRTEPAWPESALREAAAAGPDEILVVIEDATEAIPTNAFRPLTRAAIRRATPH